MNQNVREALDLLVIVACVGTLIYVTETRGFLTGLATWLVLFVIGLVLVSLWVVVVALVRIRRRHRSDRTPS